MVKLNTNEKLEKPEKTYFCGDKLTDYEKKIVMGKGDCPDCGGGLLEGPTGGLSVNVKCSLCGAKFNEMGPFGVERISDNFVSYYHEM